METQMQINPESLSWLLEPDNPGVRYLTLRDLVEISSHDPELLDATETAHRKGTIAAVLDNSE
ncbi:MAG: hypothetical protein P8Y68_11955, partial [Anaerolineales bacterium]